MATRKGRRPSKPPAELLQPDAWAQTGLPRQWADQCPQQVAAAHRRAAQLVAGGWGAVDWGEGTQTGQLDLL